MSRRATHLRSNGLENFFLVARPKLKRESNARLRTKPHELTSMSRRDQIGDLRDWYVDLTGITIR